MHLKTTVQLCIHTNLRGAVLTQKVPEPPWGQCRGRAQQQRWVGGGREADTDPECAAVF